MLALQTETGEWNGTSVTLIIPFHNIDCHFSTEIFGSGSFACDHSFGIFRLERFLGILHLTTFAWIVSPENNRLVTLAWDRSLEIIRLGFFAWDLRSGSFAWDLPPGDLVPGNFRLGFLDCFGSLA